MATLLFFNCCRLLIILLLNLNLCLTQTVLQSTFINGIVTLKLESSPYIVQNDLIIRKNSKLIIEPGVELRFNKGKQLVVHGTLEAKGTEDNRIRFTKNSDFNLFNSTFKWLDHNSLYNTFRLVEGESIQDGKLQIFYNNQWRFVCSNYYNWSEIDANITCKSLGYLNGTFYYHTPASNYTHHMKIYLPQCSGNENHLFECPGTIYPELGRSVCDSTNVVSLVCEGFNRDNEQFIDNWGGIVFEKFAPYTKMQQFSSVFYNISRSILDYVDVSYAGFSYNQYKQFYYPSSAITVFQYAPTFNHLVIQYSAGNGLNYSNIEAPAFVENSIFRFNKGHGVIAKTRFGNVSAYNINSHDNFGDGFKYYFNNSVWSKQEEEEYFDIRYIEYCHSQNPLNFPTYYRFKNPNYVRECSKLFSTDLDLRITLHFQKVVIKSKYIKYWLEVYDGLTELNTLIANYTFKHDKSPESLLSRSNNMLVKIKFQCVLTQQTFDYKPSTQRSRIFCPNSSDEDDITLYAMISNIKDSDLTVRNSLFSKNQLNGLNITNMRSLVQLNYTHIEYNSHLSGLHIHGGASTVQTYQCRIENNYLNGINISYSGGYKEFNYTLIKNNGMYGLYVNYDLVNTERDNLYQNTTINASQIEGNYLTGVWLGSYCNQSNITINGTAFIANKQDGLVINSCKFEWYTNITILNETANYTYINISWNYFDSNRLNGIKFENAQNLVGIFTNNTFRNHKKGAFYFSANKSKTTDALIRNISLDMFYNYFYNNTGRYAVKLELNELNQNQYINFTGNRFEYNYMYEPFKELNSRSTVSAVLIASSSRIFINRNYFHNPQSKIQIGTHLSNSTAVINALTIGFTSSSRFIIYNIFKMNVILCNAKWHLIKERIFDFSNRSNLAQIVYWPYSCNENYEPSSYLQPPHNNNFNLFSTNDFGGIYDIGESVLPVDRYLVTHDIVIRPSAKLIIRSGTQLNFFNGIGILVQGELQMEGTPSSYVQCSLAKQNLLRLYSIHPDVQFARELKQLELKALLNTTNSTINGATPIPNTIQNRMGNMPTIRLVGGNSDYDGRLEVEINGQRGTVCNRGWSLLNSQIVCQQLGLIVDPNIHMYSKWSPEILYQTQYTQILMSEIECDSLDTSIFDCRYTKSSEQTCTHEDDVWLKCLKPSWAGIHFAFSARKSKLQYVQFDNAGQYDYAEAKLAPALKIDYHIHDLSNITFQYNIYNSLEILFNNPFSKSVLYNLLFNNNYNSTGLMLKSSYVTVQNLYAFNQTLSAIEFNPYFKYEELDYLRLNMQPYRGTDVKRELTRLKNDTWFIGSEQYVYLYTDVEYNYGPKQLSIKIETTNDRVLVVDIIDYNTNFDQEQVLFCERLCKNSIYDSNSREWNLSSPSNSIYFPINTSYSVLHINYTVEALKSGRLTFIVYSVKAPERVYDFRNPGGVIIKNIMPDNAISIINSTFYANRHSLVYRHYDDTEDVYGNLRKRTFNLTLHVAHSIFDSNTDDTLVSELGYQMNDLVPSVKMGPFGHVNVTFDNCLFTNNYGGLRSMYRYHEYSNTIWHFELRSNRFIQNNFGCLKIFLPRLYRFAIKNEWENTTHTMRIHNNEFYLNRQFEFEVDGYYSQINLTSNTFNENKCRIGLLKFSGTEKDFYIYDNRIERNEANYIFDMDAHSHADNDLDIESLFVDNYIEQNRKSVNFRSILLHDPFAPIGRTLAPLLIHNSPSSYTIAIRGIQNCTFRRNVLQNEYFDYEFVGGLITNTLNTTVDATQNWWGNTNSTLIKQRIFDIHEWNNHAIVNYIPYRMGKFDYQSARSKPQLSIRHDNFYVLGGLIESDLELPAGEVPYQIRADLTVMPGVTLKINAGVEMEFYPNVGILVLGDLIASGTSDSLIKMRPVNKLKNRMPYYSTDSIFIPTIDTVTPGASSYGVPIQFNTTKELRLFSGLNKHEGFLQVYNYTLRSWTMVCDRQFSQISAQIVCKQLNMEYRNAFVHLLSYYMAPQYQLPVWNQTFICKGGEFELSECDTFANYHMQDCVRQGEFTYVTCSDYNLPNQYEPWGGVRFSQAYFESNSNQLEKSIMNYIDIYGTGLLHNVPSPAVQLIYRTPQINNCIIRNSTYHGIEFIQPKQSLSFNNLQLKSNLGYGINSLLLNIQTTDLKSSYNFIKKNTISNPNLFGVIDICDPHKHYYIDQRILIYYKYTNLAKDCVKIIRNRFSTNSGTQLGIRFMQLNLVNNTVQNDTIEMYNGAIFNKNFLIKTITNGSSEQDIQRFYVSKTDTLSIYMKASVGREYYGFIAEIISYPTSQYLSPDTFIEITDSNFESNQYGSMNLVSAGERNPNLYLTRNRFVDNGYELFNTTSQQTVDILLQNVQKFYFGNNYVLRNYGGVTLNLFSGSGVLITRSYVFNNVFDHNKNNTVLLCKSDSQLPYNELNIYRNLFINNYTPRTDVVYITSIISQFLSNQLISNQGTHILSTNGFQNLTTTRNQEISFNLLRENYAYGLVNDLQSVDRFRSTMLAGSFKQVYYSNYLFNLENDFELIALNDPLSAIYGSYGTQINTINATYNYWSTSIDSEIRARIRDKYDNESLYEILYSPPVLDEFQIRDGKCELGWSLIDDICYLYIGSYNTYKEAENTCKALRSRLARHSVSPTRLQRFRQLARNSQFNFESQTYRKLWLHTENPSSGSCVILDDYVTTTIQYADCLEDMNTFLCEKDPVFLGAQFRFKDELAFAIGGLGVLVLCVCPLCLLWVYKSHKRKKEHMHRQDTLRRSARANRHILNSTKSTKSDELSSQSSSSRYVTKHPTLITTTQQKSTSDLLSDQQINAQRKRIFTNRFKKSSTKLDDEDEAQTENDYHIYDMNVDEDADVTMSANSTIPRNNRKNYFYNDNDSPTKISIKTTETYYTDTLVRMGGDKKKIETQLIKPSPISPSRSTNTYQSTPGILKKSNIFTSSYDHLASSDERNEQSSDDFMMESQIEELKTKSNRNLTTFSPTKSISNLTNVTQIPNELNYSLANSSSYENLYKNKVSNIQPPVKFPPAPARPPPIPPPLPPSAINNTNKATVGVNCETPQSLLISAISSPSIRSSSKYTLAAESEIAGETSYRAPVQLQSAKDTSIQQFINGNSSGSSTSGGSYTMKKPQILAEINKSPTAPVLNTNINNNRNNQINTEVYAQFPTTDLSKPPPMETEI